MLYPTTLLALYVVVLEIVGLALGYNYIHTGYETSDSGSKLVKNRSLGSFHFRLVF
jgi:hypothetical protein